MQIRWQRRDLLDLALLVGIAAVATALRLAWVIRSKTFPVEGIDTLFYDERAQRLAAGFGYSYQAGTEGIPTGLFPPGYPFALAGWYKLFGTSLEAAQLFNVVISVVLVLAIYLLGRLALGRTEAIVGSLLWAVFPSQILWTSLLMPELLFALAITLSMVFVYVSSKSESTRAQLVSIAVAGALAGAATLMKGQAMGLFLVVALWLVLLRDPLVLRKAALFTVLMVLVLVPWTVRNAVSLNAPVLISTTIGWNAVIGHHDNADGGFWSPARDNILDYVDVPNPLGDVKRNQLGVRLAWDWARSHPKAEMNLVRRKVLILWEDDDDAILWQELGAVPQFIGDGERAFLTRTSNYFYYGILAAAGVGLVDGVRRRSPWALLAVLVVAYWTAFHVLFFAANRYHYPLAPILSLTAAMGLLTIARGLPSVVTQVRQALLTRGR